MSNDSTANTLKVAAILCIVCSIVVSTAAVGLKSTQQANKSADKKQNILAAANLLDSNGKNDIDALFERIDVKIVNVETGEYLTEATAKTDWEKAILADPAGYDQRKAAKTVDQNKRLSAAEDTASIKRQAKYATVYLAKGESGNVETIVLPVHGYGLWSTLYGFLALEPDTKTVVGFGFYEHGETPGLGGEVDNDKWKALWPGKQVFDAQNNVDIMLAKGAVDANDPKAIHRVDGLAGATLTSRGVSNLLHFWLGSDGFGPYLKKVRATGV